MEKRNLWIILILVICIINLGVSLLILSRSPVTITPETSSLSTQALPETLQDAAVRNELFINMRDSYNVNDYEALWRMLDPMAQSQIPFDDFKEQLTKLKDLCGKIDSGTYSYYESVATTQGIKQFKLHYLVKLERGKGDFQIYIGQQGNEPYRLFGWFLNKTL